MKNPNTVPEMVFAIESEMQKLDPTVTLQPSGDNNGESVSFTPRFDGRVRSRNLNGRDCNPPCFTVRVRRKNYGSSPAPWAGILHLPRGESCEFRDPKKAAAQLVKYGTPIPVMEIESNLARKKAEEEKHEREMVIWRRIQRLSDYCNLSMALFQFISEDEKLKKRNPKVATIAARLLDVAAGKDEPEMVQIARDAIIGFPLEKDRLKP